MDYEAIKILLALGAAWFTYFRFFREGTHHQRIQFDLDWVDLGIFEKERVIEIGCIAENKGNVEQRFDDIRVKVRGIEHGPLTQLKNHEPRLDFKSKLREASLIPARWQYFFVRPKVKQRFPLVISIPKATRLILIRATFRYKNSDNIHSAERAFQMPMLEFHDSSIQE